MSKLGLNRFGGRVFTLMLLLVISTGCSMDSAFNTSQDAAGQARLTNSGLIEAEAVEVASVTRQVLHDKEATITKDDYNGTFNVQIIKAKLLSDETATVRITPKGPDLSQVSVQVGLFGNRQNSGEIYRAIDIRSRQK